MIRNHHFLNSSLHFYSNLLNLLASSIPWYRIYCYSKSNFYNLIVSRIRYHLFNFHCNILIYRNLNYNSNSIYTYHLLNQQFFWEFILMNFQLRIYYISISYFCSHHHYRIFHRRLNYHYTSYFNKNQRSIDHLSGKNLHFKQ